MHYVQTTLIIGLLIAGSYFIVDQAIDIFKNDLRINARIRAKRMFKKRMRKEREWTDSISASPESHVKVTFHKSDFVGDQVLDWLLENTKRFPHIIRKNIVEAVMPLDEYEFIMDRVADYGNPNYRKTTAE